jgi:hypothetical protein
MQVHPLNFPPKDAYGLGEDEGVFTGAAHGEANSLKHP